jgi:AcrR family transcriptional regulator
MTAHRQLESGRVRQKARTRSALVSATRRLLAEGGTPTVEEAAAAADISRTTAYRYFRTQRELLLAAYPEVDAPTLLPPDAPVDPRERLDLVLAAHLRITVEWEPQLRASLRLSLAPGEKQPALRGGRAIRWIQDALSSLADTRPDVDRRALAVAIRAVAGIEPLVWLTDIAGLSTARACAVMTANAFAVYDAALAAPAP